MTDLREPTLPDCPRCGHNMWWIVPNGTFCWHCDSRLEDDAK